MVKPTIEDNGILTDFGIESPNQSNTLSPMELMATVTLYAMENQQMFEENFDEFIKFIREKFQDADFVARIHALRGRERITEAVRLPKENNIFRFIDCIWFKIERSQSMYYEFFRLSIGVNLRRDEVSPLTLQKVFIRNMVCGSLVEIIERIQADNFPQEAKNRLSKWVYECCEKDIMETLG